MAAAAFDGVSRSAGAEAAGAAGAVAGSTQWSCLAATVKLQSTGSGST